MQRNYEGRGTKSFPVISGCATFLIHQCIYQFRSSPNVLFRHFYNPVSRPFLLSKCWWVGMKVLTLESFVWYFWWPDPSWSYNIDRDIRKKKSLYIFLGEATISVVFAHRCSACMGFLWLLRFPSTSQRHVYEVNLHIWVAPAWLSVFAGVSEPCDEGDPILGWCLFVRWDARTGSGHPWP